MKILRLFGLTGLVIYTISLMVSCGRVPENGSGGNEYLKTISSMSTSIINKLKLTSPPILYQIKSPSVQEDNLVSYGFSSSKAGTISYSGGCFGSTRNAVTGDHYILFITMVEGNYENLSLIHIRRCRRSYACRSRWSPYH